jgi:hypothetical protein
MNEPRRPSFVARAWSAVVILGCAFVVQGSGCDEGDDITIIGGGATLIESLFPGTPIADNTPGNDGQSLSHAELILNQGYVVFRNASNGTAILLYTDRAERLWAHYFDGTGFTPPVEIRGANQRDVDDDLGQMTADTDDEHETWRSYQVLFLNTAGHANGNAAARSGDALILWIKSDLQNESMPDEDDNFRLYGTYFDVSLAATPVAGDVRYGFDTTATPVDFDNFIQNSDDDDVTGAGFVSDSLVRTHHFPAYGPSGSMTVLEEPALSGDPTSFVHIVFRKPAGPSGGPPIESRFHQVAFDLTSASNDVPSEPSLGAGILPLPVNLVINPANDVDDNGFVVHNGDMIWRAPVFDVSEGPPPPSVPRLFLTRFAAGSAPSTIELGDALAQGGQTPFPPLKSDVYGADHGGLLALYVFYPTAGGNILNVAKSDLDAPLARETTKISINPNSAPIDVDFFATRINRTAEWILAAMIELDDTAVGNNQVTAAAVQTRGPGDGARSLANSLSQVIRPPNQDLTTFGVDYLTLQSELADGTQDPFCGVQANRNRINFAFQQPNRSDQDLIQLLHNGLIFAADVTGSAPPTAVAAVPVGEGLVDQHDDDFGILQDDLYPVLTDLGTASGAPVLYYLRNANNPLDAGQPGAFREIRVFGAPGVTGAAPTLIGTDGVLADNTVNDLMWDTSEDPIDELTNAVVGNSKFLRVQTVPLNRDVVGAPNHAGTRTHVFWQEARGAGNSLWALRSRSFEKAAFSEASPAGFGGAHVPPAPTSPPVTLDGTGTNPPWLFPSFHADTGDVGVLGNILVVQGGIVGVFFHSDDHFWYQEHDGSSWYTAAGLGDAQQIDNQFGSDLFPGQDQMGYAFPAFSNASCDNRVGTIVCFVRSLPGDDRFVRRLFARVIE